jgi:formiminotetrahydrofolate cyclodeaminase
MIDPSATLAEFLEAAAAKTPAPGGGAVAAVAGALAAAMGEMVLNYSVAKKDLLQFAEANKEALAELTKARAVLIELMREDQAAFEALTAAKKNGGDVASAVRTAIGVPQSIGATAVAILRIANDVANTSNRWLLSDLAVCGELATATVRCAVHNVRANFPDLQDDGARNTLNAECRETVQRAVALVNDLMKKIEARTSAV